MSRVDPEGHIQMAETKVMTNEFFKNVRVKLLGIRRRKLLLLLQSRVFVSEMTSDTLMDLKFQKGKKHYGGKIDHVDAIKIRNLTAGGTEISRSWYIFNFVKLINYIYTRHKYIFRQHFAGVSRADVPLYLRLFQYSRK